MNPKKVAICISGIDRSLDFCINTLKKNLIECNSERYEFYTIGYITSDNHINKLNFDKLILSTEFVNNETNETSKLPLPNLSYQKEHYKGGSSIYQKEILSNEKLGKNVLLKVTKNQTI